MKQPRSFVLRLYADEPGRTAGILEDARTGRQFRFADKEDLWNLLQRGRRPIPIPAVRGPGSTGRRKSI